MKKKWSIFALICFGIASCFTLAKPFVTKKKPQSTNKLKEEYVGTLAQSIKIIPDLHKKLARIQEQLIDELAALADNEINFTKCDLENCNAKAHQLLQHLESISSASLEKTQFTKHKNQTTKA